MIPLEPYPSPLTFLWLEITEKCNLECVHCYSESSPKKNLLGRMETNNWLTVMNDAAGLGCRQVQFIGGEPTLHPDLTDMIAFAISREFALIEVFTNATTIDDKLIASFIENNVQVATSFYSDQRSVHDAITKHPGSFDRTVSNIKRFVSSEIPVRVGIIETPANAGSANNAKYFLNQLGVFEIRMDIQRQVGRAAPGSGTQNPLSELCGQCSTEKLCVTASGHIYPCVFSRFACLDDVDNGIAAALRGDVLAEFRKAQEEFVAKERLEPQQAVRSLAHASTNLEEICGPDIICGPDRQCSPNCAPNSSKCVPSLSPCIPSRPCLPYQRTTADGEIAR